MSSILKALRRLEQERGRDDRPLRDEVVAVLPGEDLERPRPRALVWAGGGMLMALALIAVWRTGPATDTDRMQPPVASAPVPRPPEPVIPAIERRPPPSAPAPRAAVAPESALAQEPPVVIAVAPPRPAPPPAPARPAGPTVFERVDPGDIGTVERSADGVSVVSTVWHPDRENRRATVRVKGRPGALELREGDAVGALVVVGIEPGSVVFRSGEIEVRQAVGDAPEEP